MGRIVVGMDGSEGAAGALRWAAREGPLRDWSVAAVLAWGFLDQHHSDGGERFDPSYSEDDALTALDAWISGALPDEAAASIERRAVCDLAARALLEASADSDLLVVGARGLGGFRGLLLGSVSRECLHRATCPVAVVRAHQPHGTTERVVVGIDGSAASRLALEWALEEGRLREATVEVVHAWHLPFVSGYPHTAAAFDPAIYEKGARQVLDTTVDGAKTSGLATPVERALVHGGGASAILERAEGADLVVVGSRGLGGVSGLLLGSVSQQVSHHARCPVVVVPPRD